MYPLLPLESGWQLQKGEISAFELYLSDHIEV